MKHLAIRPASLDPFRKLRADGEQCRTVDALGAFVRRDGRE